MHLGHVRAPQHESVGSLEVVVTSHRLVDAERTHEAGRGGRHAVARIGIDIVRTKAGFEQFDGRVAFPHRPLTGAEHADSGGTLLLQGRLEFFRHDIERFVPGDRRELTRLVVFAVLLAQQWLRQSILAIHDLGKKIALDAIEASIDLGLDVAMRRNDTTVLGRNHHAASRAAEPARRLVPSEFGLGSVGDDLGTCGRRHAGRCRCRQGGLCLEHPPAIDRDFRHVPTSDRCSIGIGRLKDHDGRQHIR